MNLTLTKEAITHIKAIIAKQGYGIGFRVAVKTTGCSGYMYNPDIVDEIPEGDIELQQGDLRVFVDPSSVQYLEGTVLDMQEKDLGRKLVFNNPNAVDACGCGESFNIKGENDG